MIIIKFLNYIIKKFRYFYHLLISSRIKDKDVSIIANDCVGGVIYHDMGLRFLSPTINLFFESVDDYLEFLSDLRTYTTILPIQVEREDLNYPVGKIVNGDKSVIVHFMHYKSFEEAVSKWTERCKRINFNNIFVILQVANEYGPKKKDIERFDSFDFKKKLLITGDKCEHNYDYICKFDIYRNNYYPGKILSYTNFFSVKRILDKTHYYKYLIK